MNRFAASAFVLIFIVALLGLAASGRAEDPTYQGEKFSRMIEIRAPEKIARAALELGLDRTVPILSKTLERRDSVFDRAELEIWQHLPSKLRSDQVQHTPVSADSARGKTLQVLCEIGFEARGAIPALIKLLNTETNQGNRQVQVAALGFIGFESPEAMTVLEKATHDPSSAVRAAAILELGWMGPKAASAVPSMIEEIKREEAGGAWWAFEALGRMGPAASNALPVLLPMLRSGSNTHGALVVLKGMGPAAAPALPELTRMIELRQPDYPLAVETLLNMGAPAQSCLSLLESMLTDTNAIARLLAATAVIRADGARDQAMSLLVAALGKKGRSTSHWSPPFHCSCHLSMRLNEDMTAAWLLGDLGPAALEAVPMLTKAAQSPNQWLRVIALRALWRIEKKPEFIVHELAELVPPLGKASETYNALAAMTLAEIGPGAKTAVPQLEQARLSGPRVLRHEATLALRRIGVEL